MSITGAVVTTMDIAFSPVFTLSPFLSVLIFAAILSVITSLMSKYLINKEFAKNMKSRMKELKLQMKEAQKNSNKEVLSSSMKEMMDMNRKYMKESMKVMVGSLVFCILFLTYMSAKYASQSVTLPLIGITMNWIYWYVIASLVISMTLRKFTGGV
ncbi:MAG TPA: EMC3/TMCO1 family protein [archaeon]|nr:EMC3/TMCO1 family protein [archaeon]